MMKRLQTYAQAVLGTVCVWLPIAVAAQGMGGTAIPQIATPLNNLLATVTNVIGPGIAICGLIAVGVCLMTGNSGRAFQLALGAVVGGVLIAKATDLWHTFFGGST